MKTDTKLSLVAAKKIIPKGGKAQQKRVALALRRFCLSQTVGLKLEIKQLKEEMKEIREEIRAIKRGSYE